MKNEIKNTVLIKFLFKTTHYLDFLIHRLNMIYFI